ncbi:hypothetical protein EV356DRAFT_495652 [Viridothelium virens]|uniref:CENP-V/GFA domain-containing protein n=1 Tax=Viridothelium virens TaxID=1048519 RepID=A0A6A6HPR2_VIRVR|nr:hypothetical protein EV356DRAFT_495652 [Viridothelium virens]
MCRKSSGSLVSWLWTVRTSEIEPPLAASSSYKAYDSSSNVSRSFCSSCGCSLTFNYKDKPEETDIYLGTLDEECLIGGKVPGSEQTTEHGVKFERHGGIGGDWVGRGHQIYLENAVPGLTDRIPGSKFLKGSKDGQGFL